MNTRFVFALLMGLAGFPVVASAESLCDGLARIYRVEEASRAFVSSSSDGNRRAAMARMAREMDSIRDIDISLPAFGDVRNTVATFLQSRRRVLRQADDDGMASALATARTASYAGHAQALDAVYRPLQCDVSASTNVEIDQNDPQYAGSDAKGMSNHDSFDFPLSAVAMLAFAAIGGGGVGYRIVSKRKEMNKRRSRRFTCLVDVILRQNGFAYDANVHDISQLGCKIKTKHKLEIGDRVEIQFEKSRYEGIVIWGNRHYSGVEFRKSMSSDELNTAIGIQQ